MKKITLFLIVTTLSFSLYGCFGNDILDKSSTETNPEITVPEEELILPAGFNILLDGIWLLGGINSTGLVSEVDLYNPYTDTWQTNVTTIPVPVRNASAAVYGNKIYIFGGITTASILTNIVQVYDVTNNSWTNADIMPAARQGHGAINADGQIYILGGSSTTVANNGTRTIYRFSPYETTNNQWSASLGNLMYTYLRMDSGYTYLDGEILYGGGRTTSGARYPYIGSFLPITRGYQWNIGLLKLSRFGLCATSYSSATTKYAFFIGGTTVNNTAQFPATITPSGNVCVYIPYSENAFRLVLAGPNLNQSRAYAQAVTKGNYVYVFGGMAGTTSYLDGVERLNASSPFTSSWNAQASMPVARAGFCCVTIRQ